MENQLVWKGLSSPVLPDRGQSTASHHLIDFLWSAVEDMNDLIWKVACPKRRLDSSSCAQEHHGNRWALGWSSWEFTVHCSTQHTPIPTFGPRLHSLYTGPSGIQDIPSSTEESKIRLVLLGGLYPQASHWHPLLLHLFFLLLHLHSVARAASSNNSCLLTIFR